MALCGELTLEEAVDLSLDRLQNEDDVMLLPSLKFDIFGKIVQTYSSILCLLDRASS